MMIHIGVSAAFLPPDPRRPVHGPKTLYYLESDMARYLARPGVIPVLLPDGNDGNARDLWDMMDGFVFQGGADMAPESYGEAPLDVTRWPGDRARDVYELALMEYALNAGKPVLGICRGCQVINVFLGGLLHQDLPTVFGDTVVHRSAELYDAIGHDIEILSGGYLEQIFPGSRRLAVNSVHHQGIKALGLGLRVEAVSPADGVVEAVSLDRPGRFVLGVQWHPEFRPKPGQRLAAAEPIYDRFIAAVSGRADSRTV